MSDESQNPNQPPHKPDGWELACAGILEAEFGRKQSDAVANAVAQLAAQENKIHWQQRVRARWESFSLFPRFVVSLACTLAIGVAVWSLWLNFGVFLKPSPKSSLCVISGGLNPQWAGSRQPQIGESLVAGSFKLDSGVVELTFNSKARVAIEGPAQIKLTGFNSMEIKSGKLSTYVPVRARGFTVKIPSADIVDLGTRFGVNVAADKSSKVDVFEGRVTVSPDGNTDTNAQQLLTQNMAARVTRGLVISANPLDETFYPQPGRSEIVHPVNCGFDGPLNIASGDMPTGFGYWSGPAYEIVGTTLGIHPQHGAGMLHFQSPPDGKDSTVRQVMDLSAYKAMLAKGDVEIKSSVFFNRIAADNENKFVLSVAAFQGKPENVAALWAQRKELAVAVAEKELAADADPATWEKVEVSAALPPQTDFLIIEMRAVNSGGTPDAFTGHFADLIDCALVEPLYASHR